MPGLLNRLPSVFERTKVMSRFLHSLHVDAQLSPHHWLKRLLHAVSFASHSQIRGLCLREAFSGLCHAPLVCLFLSQQPNALTAVVLLAHGAKVLTLVLSILYVSTCVFFSSLKLRSITSVIVFGWNHIINSCHLNDNESSCLWVSSKCRPYFNFKILFDFFHQPYNSPHVDLTFKM